MSQHFTRILLGPMQPRIPALGFNVNHGSFVLWISGLHIWIWLVQAIQQRVPVAVARNHGEVRNDLTGGVIDPLGPQAGKHPRQTVGTLELPPDVLLRFPIGFLVPSGGDQAALGLIPGTHESWLGLNTLKSRVVGGPHLRGFRLFVGVGFALWLHVLDTFWRARANHAPLPNHAQQAAVGRTNKNALTKFPNRSRVVVRESNSTDVALSIAFGANVIEVAHERAGL